MQNGNIIERFYGIDKNIGSFLPQLKCWLIYCDWIYCPSMVDEDAKNIWDQYAFPWSDWCPCSPKSLNSMLSKLGAAPRKYWGQNFLIDFSAQKRIVQAAGIQLFDRVWEIGPGLGALTQHLWRNCHHLTLFEIDPILLNFYRSRLRIFGGLGNLGSLENLGNLKMAEMAKQNVENCVQYCCTLIAGNVAKTWRNAGPIPDIVISNLPYNVASLIMSQFAQEPNFRPRCMVFTIQKEMALRLTAQKRSKAYSSFSVLLQSQFHIECLFDLPSQLFFPKPNVISATIRLRPREHGLSAAQIEELENISRIIFSHRRKTIANNIKASQYRARFAELELKFNSLGIQCSQRAEEVSIEQFLALAQKF